MSLTDFRGKRFFAQQKCSVTPVCVSVLPREEVNDGTVEVEHICIKVHCFKIAFYKCIPFHPGVQNQNNKTLITDNRSSEM